LKSPLKITVIHLQGNHKMKIDNNRLAFGRHESFALRFAWLTKGFNALVKDNQIFTSDDSTVELGVGKNMVSSIRFWLRACQIIDKEYNPTEIGSMIFGEKGLDPYLEDEGTIWLLHWLLANNPEEATVVFWFFNKFHKPVFTTEELITSLSDYVKDLRLGNKAPSASTIKNDVSLITRMYSISKPTARGPLEDSLDSPMASLGLMTRASDGKNFIAKSESRESLPALILGFAIIQVLNARNITSIPLDELMYSRSEYSAVGAVFRLSENDLIKKMEQLIGLMPGMFEIRDTAGIYQLYKLKDADELELLSRFYAKAIVEAVA